MADDDILLGIDFIVNAIKDLTEKTDNRLLDIANSMKDIAGSLKKIEEK